MSAGIIILVVAFFVSLCINLGLILFLRNQRIIINYDKGRAGEQYIYDIIKNHKSYPSYIFCNYIVQENDKTCEIDCIYINRCGVFVIEIKTLSGKIIGKDDWHDWIQCLPRGIQNKFYNPAKQNMKHIYCLKRFLPENTPLFNCVVFASGDVSQVQSAYTMTTNGLKSMFKAVEGKIVLTDEQIKEINEILLSHESELTAEDHISSVLKDKRNIAAKICPRCAGKLILRKGPYGEFYGCSNYPECKFKIGVDEVFKD